MVNLDLYLTPSQQCSYLPERRSRSLFVDPNAVLHPQLYAQLMVAGFRRSGSHVYTPFCENCTACIPLRLPVDLFKPNRSQQRTFHSNRDLSIRRVSEITDEQVQLYRKYMDFRHRYSPMAKYQLKEYREFMQADWCDTLFPEFRLNSQLLAVAVTDQVPGSLSAVYTYYDPDHAKRALGVHAILSQVELAKQLGLDWLYLGFWIPDCAKMNYKVSYLPLQLRIDNVWQFFDNKPAIQMLSIGNRCYNPSPEIS